MAPANPSSSAASWARHYRRETCPRRYPPLIRRIRRELAELAAASRSLFEQPDGGVIKLGPSVKIGYYAQQHETLHPDWTLVQEIRDAKPMYETDAVAILQRFLFDYYAAQKQVHHLSGGERSRLQLAKLMLSDVNFLMLDEPTNNLDIPSSEVLESALEEFNGTVLVISHDRYFLDRIVDRVVVLEGGAAREIVGGYSDYVDR